MKTRYHEGIFYPANRETLLSLVKTPIDKEPAKALLVPHQEMKKASSVIKEAFRHAGSPERVIIITPIHNGRLEQDKDHAFFEGEKEEGSLMIEFGLTKAEWYSEEEPSGELIAAFVRENLPQSQYGIVYADIKSAKDSKALASFMEKWDSPSTLFVLSSNLSERTKDTEETQKWKRAAIDALLKGDYLLDRINKNQIHMCGGGIVDALSRVYPGPWKLAADEEDDTITAHASFYKEI
ncbi:MAG: hypothetical protein KBS81_06280 [Spirochaetales bacterium]|nr:hypothetical protein [Candidatus Physcosoma equi]